MEQTLCTHECKWKNISVETTSQMGRGGIKENGGGSEFK
jgi:hypothetical protein